MAQAKVLTEKELKKVLQYCDQHKHPTRNKAMLLMTHLAGLRVGEVAALRVKDVLTNQGELKDEIYLSAVQTKGSRGRTVLLPKKLQVILKDYLSSRYKLKDLAIRIVRNTEASQAWFHSEHTRSAFPLSLSTSGHRWRIKSFWPTRFYYKSC